MRRLAATTFLAVLFFVPPSAMADPGDVPSPNSMEQCPSPAVVTAFLGLTDAQASQFGNLLGQSQATLAGLQQQIAAREAQLDILFHQPNPDPNMVGGLFVQIHAIQQQVIQAVQSFQSQFLSLLTDDQKQKIQAVTLASQLQPVVGAFISLHVVPAPTPLPCQKQ